MIKKTSIILFIVSLVSIFSVEIPSLELDYSRALYDSDGALLSAQLASDEQWRFPIEGDIPEPLAQSILYFEDEHFYKHPGVNPFAIVKAFHDNYKAGRIVRGGSTITMQVMRMFRGNRSRTYTQKIIEIVGAIKLELLYSKADILKMWASVAPFGGNTMGASTASWRYFDRPLQELSSAEYATLAVLPNAPSSIHLNKNRVQLKAKRNRLLKKLMEKQIIDSLDYSLSIEEDLPRQLYKIPQHAIHLLDYLVKKHPGQHIFHTTINARHQSIFKEILQAQSDIYQFDGINNAAGIIIDVAQNEVLAYVGNTKHKGEMRYVDCVQAPRSFGSLLKPFLYAQAIDEGYFLPNELIKDIPTNFGGFIPKNFDKKFRGTVGMEEMVSKSLNVPAVRVLNYIGLNSFHSMLTQDLKLSHIHQDADHHGLSLILGGAESTMWDLGNAYKGLLLNHKGTEQPFSALRVLRDEQVVLSDFSFHPVAASQTVEAMCSVNRPKEEQHYAKMNGNKIAWKTGTSYGHRDAWSIGSNGKYLVAVWVGNETGEGVYDLTGGKKAAPILFRTLRHFDEGAGIQEEVHACELIEVCKESGMQKGKWCTHTYYEDTPRISHRLRNCDRHQVLASSGNGQDTLFTLTSSEDYYRSQYTGISTKSKIKSHAPIQKGLKIIYPEKDAIIVLPKKLDHEYAELKLEANSLNPDNTLFWFVDSQFVTSTKAPHHLSTELAEGIHDLFVNDLHGNSRELNFEIVRR